MLTDLLHRIVARPAVYDLVQTLLGAPKSLRKLRLMLANVGAITVLDVGAGTGNGLRVLPSEARYLWLDNDPLKLTSVGNVHRPVLAVLASATAIPLGARSVDMALCIAMSHHLDDRQISELFLELSRVCRSHLIFLDPVERAGSFISRLLWKYDRGSHPRRVEVLRELVQERFQIEYEEEYSIYHHYWLCSARVHAPLSAPTSNP
jgi:SAM-dependent methyltransferase